MTGYKVEMRCSPDSSSSTAAIGPQHSLAIPEHFLCIYSGPDMCVQVTDLLPGTAYEFRAAALNSHGAGPWSDIGTATTLPAAPLPPPAPQLVASSSSSLSVSWAEPYGQGSPVSSYTLNMARLGPVSGSSSSSSTNAPMANGSADSGVHHAEPHGGHRLQRCAACRIALCSPLCKTTPLQAALQPHLSLAVWKYL